MGEGVGRSFAEVEADVIDGEVHAAEPRRLMHMAGAPDQPSDDCRADLNAFFASYILWSARPMTTPGLS